MCERDSVSYTGLYAAAAVLVAGLVAATLAQASPIVHEVLDGGVVLLTYGLVLAWTWGNRIGLGQTPVEGWRHSPFMTDGHAPEVAHDGSGARWPAPAAHEADRSARGSAPERRERGEEGV